MLFIIKQNSKTVGDGGYLGKQPSCNFMRNIFNK